MNFKSKNIVLLKGVKDMQDLWTGLWRFVLMLIHKMLTHNIIAANDLAAFLK